MTMLRHACLAALLAFSAACEEETPKVTPPSDSSAKDAGADNQAVGKMKEVAKTLEGKGISAEELAKQPPPDGIFPAGVADKAHATGAPPKLEMVPGQEGTEPRIQLHALPAESQVVLLKMQVGVQGRQVQRLVFVEISVPEQAGKALQKLLSDIEPASSASPKTAPPAASASADPVASAAPVAPVAPTGDRQLVATVRDVSQGGEMGKTVDATITFTVTKAGAYNFVRKFAKETTDPAQITTRDFEIGAVEEMLLGLYTGVPDKPVGANAMWTVADRRNSFGSDVVRYRLFQVEKIEGDTAHIQVMYRQYAADEKTALVTDPNVVLGAYGFQALGKIEVSPKALIPRGGVLQLEMKGQLVAKDKKDDPTVRGQEFGLEAALQILDAQAASMAPKDADPGKDPKDKPKKKPAAPPATAPAPAPAPTP